MSTGGTITRARIDCKKMAKTKYLELFLFMLEYVYERFLRLIRGVEHIDEEYVEGKVVIVTGANSGLGKVATLEFARRGCTVIMACRNVQQGHIAMEEIKKKTNSDTLLVRELDLADLSSVRKFATGIRQEFPVIHILVNNAGVYSDADQLLQTKDGFEMHMGINHLGHFLLTNMLIDNIKRAAPSRIVNVSSTNQLIADLDLDDIMMRKATSMGFQNSLPYNNSKLANSLFSMELSRRLYGSEVTTYSLCPGLVATEVFRNFSPFRKFYTKINLFFVGLTAEQGCETILHCALSKKCAQESGLIYRFSKHFNSAMKRLDTKMASRLWEINYFGVVRDFIMGLHATPCQLAYFLFEYIFEHILQLYESVDGKVIIVTGANSGLGKYTAEEMAKRGAVVIMGCRNMTTGKEAQNEIKEKSGSTTVELYSLDLSEMASIRSFAATVLKEHPVIDILVNNAGISLNDPERSFTKDGFEMHMGTNHLGHFLLTNLLMESLKKSTIKRVVTVSSTACVMSNIDLSDLMMDKAPNLGLANTMQYNNSKFANALFTKELAKRMEPFNVKAYSICPGLAKTDIFRHYSPGVRGLMNVMSVFGIPVDKGADSILLCGLAQEVAQDSGKIFRFSKHFAAIEKLFTDEMAEGLWELSEKLVGLKKPQ
ncbi:Retinol dehydrogenase 11 [Orchesella cincta]|uniref:Retinol dehydrogenase 11 n=1 Tax=Orchesella cincta TaxID=48709 RepID=A0A1D2NEX7_ORCCI|nr:Retinol dehydrogenase 11 [Orchesella cincta]